MSTNMINNSKVIEVVIKATERDLNIDEVTLESNFQDDLVFDSLAAMTLAVYIQEEFLIDVSQYIEQYIKVQTIRDLVDLLNRNSKEI